MHVFLAEYSFSATTISILDKSGYLKASRDVYIPIDSFVKTLTSELIDLSHEQNLYHNDIFAMGLVVSGSAKLHWESNQKLQEKLKSSFGFPAVVGPYKELVRVKTLAFADTYLTKKDW